MLNFVKKRYKLFLFLLLFWFLLQLNFRIETIILGIITSVLITMLSYHVLYDKNGFIYKGIKLRLAIFYTLNLFIEIFKAGFVYIANLLFTEYEVYLFTLDLDFDDHILIGIIANSITLTPGTISIEVNTEKHSITVMMMAKKGTSEYDLKESIHNKFIKLLKQEKTLND